jgi:hypothetical protein
MMALEDESSENVGSSVVQGSASDGFIVVTLVCTKDGSAVIIPGDGSSVADEVSMLLITRTPIPMIVVVTLFELDDMPPIPEKMVVLGNGGKGFGVSSGGCPETIAVGFHPEDSHPLMVSKAIDGLGVSVGEVMIGAGSRVIAGPTPSSRRWVKCEVVVIVDVNVVVPAFGSPGAMVLVAVENAA